MRWWMLVVLVTGCTTPRLDAAPDHAPAIDVHPIAASALCVTKGALADQKISEPTVRAFALGSAGDAASLRFTYRADAGTTRELASGQARRQVGLKLRAQDSCNVVYVMWRLDPKPKLEVSVKYNPGMRTHEECGANGYTKVKPAHASPVPELAEGDAHTLRAEITGDQLTAWIDGRVAWQGTLPGEARQIQGPAGLRTDNLELDGLELAVARGDAGPVCKRHERDD